MNRSSDQRCVTCHHHVTWHDPLRGGCIVQGCSCELIWYAFANTLASKFPQEEKKNNVSTTEKRERFLEGLINLRRAFEEVDEAWDDDTAYRGRANDLYTFPKSFDDQRALVQAWVQAVYLAQEDVDRSVLHKGAYRRNS